MANHNCLKGIRCPQCGNEERFVIGAEAFFSVTDNGTEGYEDVEWDDGSYCRCVKCGKSGVLADFADDSEEVEVEPEYTGEYACPTCYERMSRIVEANLRRCKCGEEFTV